MTRGRPIRGIFAGLLLGICLSLDLILLGAVKLDDPIIIILPIVLTVVGFGLGLWAPLGRSHMKQRAAPATALPPPMAWPESAAVEGSTPPPPYGGPAVNPLPQPPPPPSPEPPPPSSEPPAAPPI